MKPEASTQRFTALPPQSGKSRLSILGMVLQWPGRSKHQIFVERMKESKHFHPVLFCIICSEKGGRCCLFQLRASRHWADQRLRMNGLWENGMPGLAACLLHLSLPGYVTTSLTYTKGETGGLWGVPVTQKRAAWLP